MTKLSLTDREWKEFYFSEIFSKIQRGKRLTKENQKDGKIPYISSSSTNNGVDNFISNNENIRKFGYCLTLANSGSVGSTFFQNYEFVASDHVTALIIKNPNKYVYLFLANQIQKIKEKYSFNREINDKRIKREKIILPINNQGNPDWQFMEDYIKQLEQEKVQEIVNYYQNKLLEHLTNNQTGGGKSYLKKWANFKIEEIFSFESKPSKGLNHLDKCENGGINYIGATNRNNGVLGYVKPYPNLIYRGNAIAFIRNGEGAMGYSIYKKENFIATQDISVGYNENLTEYSGLFITTIADMVRGKYNFGYKRNQSRLNNETLRLPINEQGNPDWQFMENFIKNIEKDKITLLLNHYRDETRRDETRRDETRILWAEFELSQVFYIKSGIRLTKKDMIGGNMPFIGATEFNNGITEFIGNNNNSLDENVLGVNYNGSVVENFYHPYQCVFSDDVKRFELKSHANKWVYLFIKTMILNQKEKYQYGYKFNATRMAKQKIMLPIDSQGNPDWQFMENYIKQIELNHILSIIGYYQNQVLN